MGYPQAPPQQPPPKFLAEQLLLPAGTPQYTSVLLGPPDQVGDHFLQGAIGDGLVHGIASLPWRESICRVWAGVWGEAPPGPIWNRDFHF